MRVERLTPAGVGGVAVLALRGAGSLDALAALTRSLPAVGRLRLCLLEQAGELLDEALIVRRADEHFELGLHGSPAVVEAVILALGAGSAPPPSLSSSPSVEQQALVLLEGARTDRAARVLLDQARGALRREVEALRGAEGGAPCWADRYLRIHALLHPPTVVLAGPVNAGKSTLFNLWVGERRAVTSDEEGTTRDAIAARVTLGHHQVELIDTAGERGLEVPDEDLGRAQDAAAVEALGQALAADLRERADLCVWLVPPGDRGQPPQGALVIPSRCDTLERWPERGISVLTAPEQSLARVSVWVAEALGIPEGDPWTPGAGVPLNLDMAVSLDAAFEAAPGEERDTLLDFVLGPAADPLPLP